ncbi:hypothetical protein [Sorangium sp. So ce204]|uniref:hypothetical protein n=1 Tax=Sorangium sp. So ce204 TaxID=3133288 RepID=UPI003F5E032E
MDGDTKVTLAAEELIIQSATTPIERIVLVYDADDPHPAPGGGARQSDFDAWAIKQKASRVPDTEEFELTGGMIATRLSIVVWGAPDAASALLPPQQTLERLVCAAIAEAYPTRGKAVSAWLASRPEPPFQEKLGKTHAASHMVGWFSDRGYEGLFDAVWEDAAVREALLARLGATGSARVVNELVGAPG